MPEALNISATSADFRPLFITATSAGPTGYDRELENGPGKRLLPAYTEVVVSRTGTVEEIEFHESKEIKLQWHGAGKRLQTTGY